MPVEENIHPPSQLREKTHLVSTWKDDGIDGVVHANLAESCLLAGLTVVLNWCNMH